MTLGCSVAASLALAGATAQDVIDLPHLSEAQVAAYRDACRSFGETGIIDEDLACLNGVIDTESLQQLQINSSAWRILVAHSPGGDLLTGLEVGRALYTKGAALIVDTVCFSSCANYLVPGAHHVYIPEGSVVGLHGSAPSHHIEFAKMRSASLGYGPADFAANPELVYEIFDQFEAFRSQVVVPETEFFAEIYVPRGYLDRYWEVERTLELRPDYACRPSRGLTLIPGPIYFEAFNAGVVRQWWPEDRAELLEPIEAYLDTYSVIADFDEHPIWLSQSGLVEPGACEP